MNKCGIYRIQRRYCCRVSVSSMSRSSGPLHGVCVYNKTVVGVIQLLASAD